MEMQRPRPRGLEFACLFGACFGLLPVGIRIVHAGMRVLIAPGRARGICRYSELGPSPTGQAQ